MTGMLSKHRTFVVWIALVVLTLLSYASLGATMITGPRITSWVVIAIALVKAWMIGMRYMELDAAARPLRLGYLAWLVLAGAAMTAAFW